MCVDGCDDAVRRRARLTWGWCVGREHPRTRVANPHRHAVHLRVISPPSHPRFDPPFAFSPVLVATLSVDSAPSRRILHPSDPLSHLDPSLSLFGSLLLSSTRLLHASERHSASSQPLINDACRSWEVRHGGMLGLKYLIAVREESVVRGMLHQVLPVCPPNPPCRVRS